MNSYLLLRDNKQSGPYTVAELFAMGIKAYDLVWLEGKSAAWRYPSEVEELKAYAPAVEEQPFDRFYKKPAIHNEDHERFEPRPSDAAPESKKVYINFPGGTSLTPSKKPRPIQEEKKVSTPVVEKQPAQDPPTVDERKPAPVLEEQLAAYSSSIKTAATPKKADKKIFYGVIAACILMLAFTAILLINNSRQRRNLRELNTIVQQMESRKKSEQKNMHASLVENDGPAEQAAPATIQPLPPPQIDEGSVYSQKEVLNPKQVAHADAKKKVADQEEASVVFKESTKPAGKESMPAEEVSPAAASKENLLKLVNITPNEYKVGLLGGISNLKFEITNNSLVPLQRVSVEVKYLGPEKKIVRTQTVFFENVAPGAQETIEVPKSNRGVSIEYAITDIKS